MKISWRPAGIACSVLTVALAIPVSSSLSQDRGQIYDAIAEMENADGENVGAVTLSEPLRGRGVIVDALLVNLPSGAHAFHIHETGECTPPDFTSAGGHYNPTNKKHGIANPDGMHAGDLPNIYVPLSGELQDEMFAMQMSLDENLFDEDGASIVIHANPDDYRTDPAGDAGPRIACGVIKPANPK